MLLRNHSSLMQILVISGLVCFLSGIPSWLSAQKHGDKESNNEAGSSNKSVVRNTVVSKGMEDERPGVPPYGVASDGRPLWPVKDRGEPPAIIASPPAAEVTGIVREVTNMPSFMTPSPNETALKMQKLQPAASTQVSQVKAMIADHLTLPVSTPSDQNTGLKQEALLNSEMIEQFKAKYVQDCQRHAQYVYAGESQKALLLSSKWLNLARMYPTQINEISGRAYLLHGCYDFLTWIEKVVAEDLKAAGNTSP